MFSHLLEWARCIDDETVATICTLCLWYGMFTYSCYVAFWRKYCNESFNMGMDALIFFLVLWMNMYWAGVQIIYWDFTWWFPVHAFVAGFLVSQLYISWQKVQVKKQLSAIEQPPKK